MGKTVISCFISPHGFGHATRTIAVLEALHKLIPDLHVQLITTVPKTLFNKILIPCTYHEIVVDVGLLQSDAFSLDLPGTSGALSGLIPYSKNSLTTCCRTCQKSELILCDISPLGICAGKQLGIPSVLIENFTWNWIYSHLPSPPKNFAPFVSYFAKWYSKADFHIQAEPVCHRTPCDITCQPIARQPVTSADDIKQELRTLNRKIILITMGGIPLDLPFVNRLSSFKDYYFILAGQKHLQQQSDNVLLLPHDTPLYHPDLINASHLVICKSGYSTIAECSQSKSSICCVSRNDFAESRVLDNFVQKQMNGTIIDQHQFSSGAWLDQLAELLTHTRSRFPQNGAKQAAGFIASLLKAPLRQSGRGG